MCIIFTAFDRHPKYSLILLANRDEFYNRPTAAAGYWKDFPDAYGGRDLAGGGTWLGVTKKGRFAAVTNYRDPGAPPGTVSRGSLVADFLKNETPAEEYLLNIKNNAGRYSGFNLLVGEINAGKKEFFYYSNHGDEIANLRPGTYGLSNHLLDTPWPKVEKGSRSFAALIKDKEIPREKMFALLRDEALAPDADLPGTGVPREIEKALSAIFIKMPGYGTRCSTLLTIDGNFAFEMEERVFI